MTEGSDDGKNLVRVRAQVMMRDDSTGGWVPMGGGGLSNVSVRKRNIQPDLHDHRQEYLIYGKRISDQTVVLCCTIKKDFEYNKVMPTFHHWRTGDNKFGLTFQTAADARAFDRGVKVAVDDLLEGFQKMAPCSGVRFGPGSSRSYIHWGADQPPHPTIYTPSEGYSDVPPSYAQAADVEDDVFMTIDLPVERESSRSSSGSVTTTSSSRHTPTTTPLPTPDHPPDHLHTSPEGGGGVSISNISPSITGQSYPHTLANHHKITYGPRSTKPVSPQNKKMESECEGKGGCPLNSPRGTDKNEGDSYSYIEFTDRPITTVSQQEFHHYPLREGKRESISSLKKDLVTDTDQLTSQSLKHNKSKYKRGRRMKCRYCHESFTDDSNSRGSCEYAPDCVRAMINRFTCISCAQCMLYHCMSDAEGDFAPHPCECEGLAPPPDESCGKRWIGLALLSLIVPCLWCYPPLRACHSCAVTCGMCGGRHQAS